jgi:hypothetical protein
MPDTEHRFDSVADRFVSELRPLAQGQVSKDLDMKYENLVKGVRHLQIKVGLWALHESPTNASRLGLATRIL